MATRQYIGARYVPKFFENPNGTCEWLGSSIGYEALTIVTYLNNSFTSKKTVPAGVDISDTNYWVNTGNYNAQLQQIIDEIDVFKEVYAASPEMYGAKGDGITDDTVAFQRAITDGNVTLEHGKTYLISDAINVPSNRVINGNGATVKIADDGSLVCLESDANKAVFVIKGKTNVTVNNIIFDLNGSSLGLYNDSTKLVNTGVIIDNSSDVSVYNCRFINAYTECVWVHATSENINVCYNYFKHVLQNQGLRKTGVYCVSHTGNMNVSYNTFDELDIQPQYGCGGIFFANVFGAECSYNRVINCGRSNAHGHPVASICVYDSCENINIIGNYINSVESFIRMDGSRGIRVSKNVCIYDKPNYYSDSDFIRFAYTSNDLLDYWGDIVIEDNIINIVHTVGGGACAIGIVNGRNDKASKSFFIRNNKIWSRGAHAILIGENISGTVISGNHIVGNTSMGNISISGGGNHVVTDNVIDYGSILVKNSGSSTVDVYDVVIANNRAYAVITDSLTVQNAALVNVHDNDLSGKSVYINNANTDAVFVHDNHLHDSSDSYQFIGTNAHQHDNYYGNSLVNAFT